MALLLMLAAVVTLFAVDDARVSNGILLLGLLISFIDDYRSGALRRNR